MQIHQVHRLSQDSPVPSTPGIIFLVDDILLPPTPQMSGFNMSPILSSPWETRRMPTEVRPYLTSDLSPCQPSQFEQGTTSSFAREKMDATLPPQSAATLPLRVSVWSAPQTSSPLLGRSASKWVWPDLDLPQKTSLCTLSDLAET